MRYAPASRKRRPGGRRQRGYVYLLMVVLLIVGSLYAILNRLDAVQLLSAQGGTTTAALTKARDALLGYAVTYRESHPDKGFGYLPCPDMNGDGEAEPYCGDPVSLGLLPYKTLGLPDLRDASGACLWYALGAQFSNNPKTDPMNWDAQGGIAVADASGTHILLQNGDARGGAAAVIFAPGAPLQTQAGRGNNCGAVPSATGAPALYLETTSSPFRQGPGVDANGNTVINDQLLWLSSADIFARVRARNDFATYLNAGIKGIQSALSFALPTPETNPDFPSEGANMLPAAAPASLSKTDQAFYAQWRDQFRYRKCSITGSYCFQLGTQKCDGVLFFGGEGTDGNPRPTTARALANYLESPTLSLATGGTSTLSSVNTVYATTSLATRSQDLALCLSPQTQSLDTSAATSPTPIGVSSTVVPDVVLGPTAPQAVARYVTDSGPAYFQLGLSNDSGSASSDYGCLWYPEPLQLGTGSAPIHLRAYFAFTVDALGQGFTFAIADADSGVNPSATMCGNGGAMLSYAGSNGVTASIGYPKMALEIDTHQDAAQGDLDDGHMAIVHWGTDGSKNDDNTHGAGNNASATDAAYQPYIISTGKTYLVRMDVKRTYDAVSKAATFDTYAYITTSDCAKFYANLSSDLSSQFAVSTNLCTYYSLHDVFSVTQAANGPVPLKQIWIGFTSSQGSTGQSIRVQPFALQISQ